MMDIAHTHTFILYYTICVQTFAGLYIRKFHESAGIHENLYAFILKLQKLLGAGHSRKFVRIPYICERITVKTKLIVIYKTICSRWCIQHLWLLLSHHPQGWLCTELHCICQSQICWCQRHALCMLSMAVGQPCCMSC